MRELFAANLRLLSELASPWRDGKTADLNQLRTLRDRISTNFASVNSQADAVLFELGPSRRRDLQLRDRLLSWQPRLRSVFLLEVGLLQYRLQVRPHELAAKILQAQDDFDRAASGALQEMADAFEKRRKPAARIDVHPALEALDSAIHDAYQGQPSPRAQGVLAFSANLAALLDHLQTEFTEQRPL
jgi:transposase